MHREHLPLFATPDVARIQRPDGSILLHARKPLTPIASTVLDWFADWSRRDPDATFLAERSEGGAWRRWRYGDAFREVCAVGAALRDQGCGPDRCLVVVAPNSIRHAALAFGAMAARIPYVAVSALHLRRPDAAAKLRQGVELLRPGAIYGDEVEPLSAAVAGAGDFVLLGPVDADALRAGVPDPALPAAVDAATVAKILLTSGSTGIPKAVVHTHGMMATNNQMSLDVWPFLQRARPVFVDWLPWSHCFGSNNNLNLALRLGGTLYIDGGSPRPDAIGISLANLREVAPTMYFNVPAGFAALMPHLEQDAAFRRHFLSRLDAVFYAGAALPADLRARFDAVASAERGVPVPVLTGWGATETGPAATFVHAHGSPAGNIGTPAPGVTLKLQPVGDKLELRVKSPSVTPGYFRDAAATARVFDDEGFYCTGDAGRLADADAPERGLVFDGRIAEDFKLATGTWVSVGPLRLALVQAAAPLLADAVICAPDRDELGVLAWLCESGTAARAGLHAAIGAHNARAAGTSTRIRRLLVLDTPPCADAGEINEKGYVNQHAARRVRAAAIERLYRVPSDPEVTEFSC